jgi:nitronate monooxygenase
MPTAQSATELPSDLPPDMQPLLAASGLQPLHLAGRRLLPIVQGGMGVGVSAHRLAGSVAALGGVGTLSSVDLRRHHPDLMARTQHLPQRVGCDDDTRSPDRRRQPRGRGPRGARRAAIAGGRGLVAMNVMRAVSDYAAYVRASLEAGVHAVVVGAGLPLDLPDLAARTTRRPCWCPSSAMRGAWPWWSRSGSARSACPTPS